MICYYAILLWQLLINKLSVAVFSFTWGEGKTLNQIVDDLLLIICF